MDQNYPDIPIEMTEWTEMEQGRDIYIDSGMVLANTIQDDLTIGHVVSWQYWIAVSKYNFHDGLIYVSVNDHEITDTKRLWVMGNYSRFVRPGYQRMAVESDLSTLRATAFRSPDGSKLVLVLINNDDQDAFVHLTGLPLGYDRVTAYQTSKELNLSEIFTGETRSEFTFAPKSVTTFVYQK
jgi:O-glycosyl hydrolase